MASLAPTYLASRLSYDPATGIITWLAQANRSVQWNGRFAGKAAGSIDPDTGYLRVRVDGQLLYGHRIAWAISTGAWPNREIDHRNGDRTDNRLVNLREATKAENCQNAALRSDNASGATGVYFCQRSRRWIAEIQISGRRFHLGAHRSINDARSAYLRAKENMHGFQPVPRDLMEVSNG